MVERHEGARREGGRVKFTVMDCDQRSEMWYAARAGRATGSRAADILARIKTGEAAARRDYRVQLAIERLTGRPVEDGYVSKEMLRGIELEPAAFAAYEAHSGNIARKTGFLMAADHLVGCSLDGDVENFAGIVEVKCPKSATHVAYLKGNRVPSDYVPQLTHNLWVSGAEWADFVSFDDRFVAELQFFCVRMYREEEAIAAYAAAALCFLDEVDRETEALNALAAARRAA